MEGLIDLLGVVAGGPIIGLIGSGINAFISYQEKAQEIQLQEKKFAHEQALTRMNIEARGQEMENEAWIAQVQALAEMLKGSYEHDASYGPVSKTMAGYLRWVRPGLTFLLMLMSTAIYFNSEQEVQKQIALMIVGMTGAAISWWFADRRRSMKKD